MLVGLRYRSRCSALAGPAALAIVVATGAAHGDTTARGTPSTPPSPGFGATGASPTAADLAPPAGPSTQGPTGWAPAPDARERETARPHSETVWYGLPIVVSDAIGVGIMSIGRLAGSSDAMGIGAAIAITDGFAVHLFEYPASETGTGIGKAVLSLLMRGGLAFAACAAAQGCFDDPQGPNDTSAIAFAAGLVVAAAIDDVFLASRTIVLPANPEHATTSLTPILSRESAGLALRGTW